MCNIEDIRRRSKSASEVVVSYTDAVELLNIYKQKDIKVLGWEGWIEYSDSTLGHSLNHQGTADISEMDSASANALVKSTIMQACKEWKENPEAEEAELLFCITTD